MTLLLRTVPGNPEISVTGSEPVHTGCWRKAQGGSLRMSEEEWRNRGDDQDPYHVVLDYEVQTMSKKILVGV